MGLFDALRRLGAVEDTPWYQPEIGRHFTGGNDREVRRFLDETDDRINDVRNAANAALGVRRQTPSGGGAGGGRMETGHHVMVNLDYPSSTWYAAVAPPSWPRHSPQSVAYLHLGQEDEHVPQALVQRLMHPHVQQYLRETMDK